MDNYKEKLLRWDSTKTDVYDNLAALAHKNKMYPEVIKYYYKMMQYGYDKVGTNLSYWEKKHILKDSDTDN